MTTSPDESESKSSDETIKALQQDVMYLQRENDQLWAKIEEIEGNYTSLFERIRSWPFIKINVPALSGNG
jgi:peptidoglycan hydrolase CwlO-like protein